MHSRPCFVDWAQEHLIVLYCIHCIIRIAYIKSNASAASKFLASQWLLMSGHITALWVPALERYTAGQWRIQKF